MDYREKHFSLLEQVSKPGRYVGGEPNMILKDPDEVSIRFALAFPETYEVGMSHNGLRILYHLLNKIEDVFAERVFAPWVDMAEVMKASGVPLLSLETKTPLKAFDLVGFSLQSELTYINIPYMLDLAGIPLTAEDREGQDPLICAGGPCTANPEPLAKLIDFFVIGDGEEVVREIIHVCREGKQSGLRRSQVLEALASVDGVYVPTVHQPEKPWQPETRPGKPLTLVRRRWVEALSPNFYPTRPIVPIIDVVQDRISVEVMRGCTQGCRFCQAGYWYRPTRELEVKDIMEITGETLRNTGNREIGLLSLSTADYSQIDRLTKEMARAFSKNKVSISLPSLRADAFSVALAENVGEVKKNGFTFAPEAGSVRLRKFINKNISNQDLLQAIETAYRQGWRLIKLYFMIGLPTETDADIRELVDLIREVGKIGKRMKGGKNVNVSIGTFIPKPFTPFQWDRLEFLDVINSRLDYLKSAVRFPWSRLKWQNPQESFIEGVLSRGDRRVGEALLKAHQLGCRFDGWSEMFRWDLWMKAFEELSLDPHCYNRDMALQEVLPWDFIDIGVSKKFLLKERERSFNQIQTTDCKWGDCRGCGIPGNYADIKLASASTDATTGHLNRLSSNITATASRDSSLLELVLQPEQPTPAQQSTPLESAAPPRFQAKAYVLQYRKEGPARFLSHLNVMKLMERALLRAGIALRFTQGFNPHPKIVSSPAIPLGMASRSEYIQFETWENLTAGVLARINDCLMEGLAVHCIEPLNGARSGAITQPLHTSYNALLHGGDPEERSAELAELTGRVNDLATHLADHRRGNDFGCHSKEHDLISGLVLIREKPFEIAFSLSVNPETGTLLKPRDFLQQILNCSPNLANEFLFTKTDTRFS
jgi:radical SAM family uncharacterized protein/radical SAM-linked protein